MFNQLGTSSESAPFDDIQAGLGTDGEIDRLYFAFVYLRRQSDGQLLKAH